MFSDDKEEVAMQERISTAAARGCVERWLIQVISFGLTTDEIATIYRTVEIHRLPSVKVTRD